MKPKVSAALGCQTTRNFGLTAPLGGVPRWEAFPEVNRALVQCLLGQLVERMMTPVARAGGGGGGERG